MREIRAFIDQPLSEGAEVVLDNQTSRHLASVLRLNNGDPVTLFNGSGGEYTATLTSCSAKKVCARIDQHKNVEKESPLAITLAIGISRGDRMDTVIQKATEMGVISIIPLFTERTEVKLKGERLEKKLRHWQQIAISACEQCGRNLVPEIQTAQKLSDWLRSTTLENVDQKFVLHHRSDQDLTAVQTTPESVILLVGPEGGLSADEISAAADKNFNPLTLGPRVLRTETAPLAAIAILQYQWGDL